MFQSHQPVRLSAFFDRTHELKSLERMASRLKRETPTWLAILGPRKIGKTSLIMEFARRTSQTGVVVTRFDLLAHVPLSANVFRQYALHMVDAIVSPHLGRSTHDLLIQGNWAPSILRWAIQHELSEDLSELLVALPQIDVSPESVGTLIDLPERLAVELGLHVIVAWDEFQELDAAALSRALSRPFALLRSRWQTHRQLSYVISGSAPTMLRNLITSPDSPFFQHFEILELGVIPEVDAVHLLRAGSEGAIDETVAARLVSILGPHPFYLQVIGEELTKSGPPFDEAAIKQVLQDALFSTTGRLALVFEREFHRAVGRSSYQAAALAAMADVTDGLRLSEVALKIGAASGDTSRYLERLGDVVERSDEGHYRIADPVFRLWVAWRKPGGSVVPMRVIGDDAEKEVATWLSRAGFDLVYQSRASRGAFDLLALRGASQLGVQVKRQELPLVFSTEEWSRMRAESVRQGWRWAVAAVSPTEGVCFLDPDKARFGKTVRLHADARIDNVLMWVVQR